MITELISQYAVKILEMMGYWGAGLLMALESMIAPVPERGGDAVCGISGS